VRQRGSAHSEHEGDVAGAQLAVSYGQQVDDPGSRGVCQCGEERPNRRSASASK
jgi:hypothetical protein